MNLVFNYTWQKSAYPTMNCGTFNSLKLTQLYITKAIINHIYNDRECLENILKFLRNKDYTNLIEYHNEHSDERFEIFNHYSSDKAAYSDEEFMEKTIESFLPTIENKLNSLLVKDILL